MVSQWQTIYCSLMLLLVVLFVMLIAYSSINQEELLQRKYMEKAVQGAPIQNAEMNQAMQSLQKLKDDMGMKEEFSIIKTDGGFKAVVPDPVLFKSGDASLNETVYAVLDGIIAIAKQNDLSIRIEGHTDNVPIRTEDYPSNWELSTMRAVNILRYLQDKGGMPSNRLAAVGFAEYHPVAGNDNPEGRQKNRRIEILFRSKS
jgi:chemotaxis protein MotB